HAACNERSGGLMRRARAAFGRSGKPVQITGNSNTLAASMLQRLLQGAPGAASSAGQEAQTAGQNSPAPPALANCAGPQMSGPTMSAMMALQTQRPATSPAASDVASRLVGALDADGDGAVSLNEIRQALQQAGLNGDVSQAFAAIDKNGDG